MKNFHKTFLQHLEAKKQAEKENENETSQFSDEETKDINADVGRKDYGGDMIYPLGRHDTQDYMLL